MSIRHLIQRRNRKRLKADSAVLIERLIARHSTIFNEHELLELHEMRMRLSPPVGVKAPIVFTGYTKEYLT